MFAIKPRSSAVIRPSWVEWRLRPAAPPSSMPSLRSLDGNGTIPPWEQPAPCLGTACSPTGNVLFPIWEKPRTHVGNILFPRREKFPVREQAGRNGRPSVRARRPAEPNSHPAGKTRDPKGLRPPRQSTTMPVPRETKQEQSLGPCKTVRQPAEGGQVSVETLAANLPVRSNHPHPAGRRPPPSPANGRGLIFRPISPLPLAGEGGSRSEPG